MSEELKVINPANRQEIDRVKKTLLKKSKEKLREVTKSF